MRLSVIIVSYRVQYFLEQCLCSVRKAMEVDGLQDTEVIVVDNHSQDNTIEYLRPRFPFVRFIDSNDNLGFGKANNLAWQQSQGKYVLFLNPDTIIPEDCFRQVVGFMDSQDDAGSLGIRMIDGSGAYLKESKRGFPSPWVSFCKMSGLTTIFPTSRLFARYYLGHVDEKETQPVDILAGAFMLVRRELLRQTGGFDEQFFMYAEDIDLSYRITQAGYRNYYFADCTILHFKGESTRKDARYVELFYKAMIQFVRKHFKGLASWWYVRLLELAIRAKAKTHKHAANTRITSDLSTPTATMGDEQSAAAIQAAFANGSIIHLIKNPSEAQRLIFCEGPGFSFKDLIAHLEFLPHEKEAFIHGSGTGSVIGSPAKENQGKVFLLPAPAGNAFASL